MRGDVRHAMRLHQTMLRHHLFLNKTSPGQKAQCSSHVGPSMSGAVRRLANLRQCATDGRPFTEHQVPAHA